MHQEFTPMKSAFHPYHHAATLGSGTGSVVGRAKERRFVDTIIQVLIRRGAEVAYSPNARQPENSALASPTAVIHVAANLEGMLRLDRRGDEANDPGNPW